MHADLDENAHLGAVERRRRYGRLPSSYDWSCTHARSDDHQPAAGTTPGR